MRIRRHGVSGNLRVAALFLLLRAAAAEEEGASVLFRFDRGFDLSAVEKTDAEVSLVSGGLLVSTGHKARWPGVALKAPEGHWDLRRFSYVEAFVRNRSAEPVTLNLRVDNPGADGRRNCVGRLRVKLNPTPWRLSRNLELIGMRGAPGRTDRLDPGNVTRLLFFLGKPRRGHVFLIEKVTAGGRVIELDADRFFPFIDELGQFIHDDWPGKVHSLKELRARRAEEDRDLETHPAPEERNKYGGWTGGPKLKATGFFRVEKYKGVWWLVDPEGRLFWSHGVDCVRGGNATPITDRERYFRGLPAENSPLGRFYGRGNRAAHGYYRTHRPFRTYDFGRANRFRKYGEEWESVFASLCHKLHRHFEFQLPAP